MASQDSIDRCSLIRAPTPGTCHNSGVSVAVLPPQEASHGSEFWRNMDRAPTPGYPSSEAPVTERPSGLGRTQAIDWSTPYAMETDQEDTTTVILPALNADRHGDQLNGAPVSLHASPISHPKEAEGINELPMDLGLAHMARPGAENYHPPQVRAIVTLPNCGLLLGWSVDEDIILDGTDWTRRPLSIVQLPNLDQFELQMDLDTHSCSFYYEVASDKVVACNQGKAPVRLYQLEVNAEGRITKTFAWELNVNQWCHIEPAYWLIEGDLAANKACWVEVLLLPRQHFCVHLQPPNLMLSIASGSEEDGAEDCAQNVGAEDNPMIFPAGKSMTVVTDIRAGHEDLYTLDNHGYIVGPTGSRIVFKATHSDFYQPVAAKIIRARKPSDSNAAELAQSWSRELFPHAGLKHPSIVKVLGYDSRFFAIFTEYLSLPDLAQMSDADSMFTGSLEDATRVLKDMASVLRYLEGRKILHNDIKPGNILYDSERGAVLIDFGLVTEVGDKDLSGGTWWYVPPELEVAPKEKSQKGQKGQKAEETRVRCSKGEIYSLGVTMLYLLRMTPLPETSCPRWEMFVKSPEYQQWTKQVTAMAKETPARIGSIVRHMLEKLPEKRISAREILEELERD